VTNFDTWLTFAFLTFMALTFFAGWAAERFCRWQAPVNRAWRGPTARIVTLGDDWPVEYRRALTRARAAEKQHLRLVGEGE